MSMLREITPKELEAAYLNKDNRKIIQKVTGKFVRQIDSHELEDCGTDALLKCLRYHDYEKQKFTSSLYKFVLWECLRKLEENKRCIKTVSISNLRNRNSEETGYIDYNIAQEESNYTEQASILKCLDELQSNERSLLVDYYYEKQSLQKIGEVRGYSKETARKKILKAVETLKQKYKQEEL